MSEASHEEAVRIAAVVRKAIESRRQWLMPVLILRFTDGPSPYPGEETPYAAVPETELAGNQWCGRGRTYDTLGEFDRDELDELADYSEEDLIQYAAEMLLW
jgi:hypothetical protein